MEARRRIDEALSAALSIAETGAPPRIAAALWHAVFPGGGRLRPRLTLAVAQACGEDLPLLTSNAAASIELMHCASLVHDDLPCFDDADSRRGRSSVHKAFGEPLAVLTGDALIVLGFETLVRAAGDAPQRLAPLAMILSRSVGLPGGIAAGQAWECEPALDLSEYHRAKTGVLFAAATQAGAASAGCEPDPWRRLGERLGEAYQVADDMRDVLCDSAEIGKPTGRDATLHRRSAVADLGVDGALTHLRRLVSEAIDSIPACPRAAELKALVLAESSRFAPANAARLAA